MKFKLIKKFPDCNLELGDTINFDKSDEIEIFTGRAKYWYTLDEVKAYPEFFEEIVEKDYEILEWKYKEGVSLAYPQKDGKFSCTLPYFNDKGHCTTEDMINADWYINKVRRLSDGEVFTIGDKVEHDSKDWGIISEFIIDGNNITIKCTNELYCDLNTFKKYIEPIYVTEDGYEVKDYSTELYWVYRNTNDTYELVNKLQLCEGHLKGKYASLVSDKHLWTLFYSREKAEEFVAKKNEEKLLDSKVLSCNEVLEIADKVGIREFYYRSQFEKELKELVKSKQ